MPIRLPEYLVEIIAAHEVNDVTCSDSGKLLKAVLEQRTTGVMVDIRCRSEVRSKNEIRSVLLMV